MTPTDEVEPLKKKVAVTDPNSIPKDERVGTISIVWSKKGQILMSYPNETHIAMKMLSVCLDKIAAGEMNRVIMAKKAMEKIPGLPSSGIVRAPSGCIPAFNPDFLKKP